jgi:hypothetical protein
MMAAAYSRASVEFTALEIAAVASYMATRQAYTSGPQTFVVETPALVAIWDATTWSRGKRLMLVIETSITDIFANKHLKNALKDRYPDKYEDWLMSLVISTD